ncbi:MAG: polysaccharide deacetylase [Marmoricola sp.]|nr:polysaccharide deacetylase [Marmoricola sp.]
MRVWGKRSMTAALTIVLAPCAVLVPAAAHASTGGQRPPVPAPCSAGLVALTFDDGPSKTVTPVLVKTLLAKKVPATFFMIGSRIRTAPAAGRLVQNSGFKIGNHTWDHPQLTMLSDDAVHRELQMTRREMLADHLVPSNLMRPPYGAINPRVRRDIRAFGLVPVLWTIDSRDWAGGGPAQIAGRVLSALRPHQTNIVLQHDGVTNSPASVAAVPEIVRVARRRGFCFTHLGEHGGMADTPGPPPTPPVPAPTTTSARMSASTEAWIPRTEPTLDTTGAPLTLDAWFSAPVIEEQFWSKSSFRVLFGSPSGVVVPR